MFSISKHARFMQETFGLNYWIPIDSYHVVLQIELAFTKWDLEICGMDWINKRGECFDIQRRAIRLENAVREMVTIMEWQTLFAHEIDPHYFWRTLYELIVLVFDGDIRFHEVLRRLQLDFGYCGHF